LTDQIAIEIAAGVRAREVLNNEVVQVAFADIRQRVHQAWIKLPVEAVEAQVSLKHYQRAIDDLEAQIKIYIETGKFAESWLAKAKEKEARKQGADQGNRQSA